MTFRKTITYIVFILITLGVGLLSAVLTGDNMATFETLQKPPLSPAENVFPIVWTILFILMGISAALIWLSDAPKSTKNKLITLYFVQLAVNFFWSIIFFNLNAYLFAFAWLVLLWVLILFMIVLFKRVSKLSAWLLLPYLLWVTFAGYLNLAIWVLN